MDFIPCITCAKSFKTIEALRMHQKDTYHFKRPYGEPWSKTQMLRAYFNAYYQEHVLVLRDDQRKSRKSVQKEIRNIKEEISEDHVFYDTKIVPAGSTATQTKVNKANEYDFNLVLDGDDDIIVTEEKKVYYDLYNKDYHGNHLYESWGCHYSSSGRNIPSGYVAIKRKNRSAFEDWTYKGYIVPRKVQLDLYQEIQDATADKEDIIHVSSKAHGPAITMRIRPSSSEHTSRDCKNTVDHDIFVDFAACIRVDNEIIEITNYGWPRKETRKCLSKGQILRISNADVYLVPKHNLFWYVSFSDAAKVLLRIIDSADTCRRKCHKILKTDFLLWHSEDKYPGISTFIFKNHLFWFNEELNVDNCEEYWNESNIGTCYIDLLTDLAKRLDLGMLMNYFNVNENILQDKDQDMLHRLSQRIRQRVQQLRNIRVE